MLKPASVLTGSNSSSATNVRLDAPLRPPAERPFSLINARIVLPDRTESTSLVVRDGLIHRIGAAHAAVTRRYDCGGDYLLPGLVELHTDNVEKHLEPRPGTFWNTERAVFSHDAELGAAGITTAFDAVTLGGDTGSARDRAYLQAIACIAAVGREGLLRVQHPLHLRCELSDQRLPACLTAAAAHRVPSLISLMDHTPGQGQWTDVGKFRAYYARRYGLDAAQIDLLIERRQIAHAEHAARNRIFALEFARRHGCAVASHDAATSADVSLAHREGCALIEFPTTLEAARTARTLGLRVIAGAPNLVRGGSHSGNVAAAELAREGVCDILSSDYCPSSLLHAVFVMARECSLPLHAAAAAVSSAPARALGLHDRGLIAEGKRADLIRVRDTDHGPILISTWCEGRQVA